jgi:hypothetical protein
MSRADSCSLDEAEEEIVLRAFCGIIEHPVLTFPASGLDRRLLATCPLAICSGEPTVGLK